ncbi:hypothetical protein KEM56_000079 [Ascosphaera pollenicola]|nr:hypothetical protein KEM56_000079 [Ascosphaera pollenicola]
MTKVVEYAPSWLTRTTPAHNFLTGSYMTQQQKEGLMLENDFYDGPRRTIARRGREIFAVIDKQIRWADLAALKDQWQESVKAQREPEHKPESVASTPKAKGKTSAKAKEAPKKWRPPYRILNANVYGEITQLSISPDGVFMIIVTRHTIHVAVLPDASHLTSDDRAPLKIKTFQLGPTEHVRPQSPVISALWHPLSVYDTHCGCIVTVTRDACLRLWEFNKNDHSSFDKPTVAVDLKKLADAKSSDEDLSPAGFTSRAGFSFDLVDMEVASACFGGNGFAEEDPWSPFTLWIALRTGTLYALCPLLPSKWQVPSFSMPILTDTLLTAFVDLEDGDSEESEEFYLKQHKWLSEIDSQQPLSLPESCQWRIGNEIRLRPDGFSAIPKLQGPFLFDHQEGEDDMEVTDIMVIPARTDLESILESGDELAEDVEDGPPVTMIVVATKPGIVYTCIQTQGISADWLPKHVGFSFAEDDDKLPDVLLTLECLETARDKDKRDFSWLVLTQDVQSRYSFYVTNACYVSYVSFSDWADKTSKQFADPENAGVALRMDVICDGPLATREIIAKSTEVGASCTIPTEHLPACLVFYDYDLGYLLLTTSPARIHAAILDHSSFATNLPQADDSEPEEPVEVISPHRLPYQAPSIFYSPDPLENFLKDRAPRDKDFLTGEIVLSPATLDVIVNAHAILSRHTAVLERAAAGLFVRAQRLNDELHDQLVQMSEVSSRIIAVNDNIGAGVDASGNPVENTDENEDSLTGRVLKAKKRQESLQDRYERVKSNLLKAGGKPLTFKEKSWFNEVELQSRSLESTEKKKPRLVERVDNAKSMAQELIAESKRIAQVQRLADKAARKEAEKKARISGKSAKAIPPEHGRSDVKAAMQIIDRESSMIDTITARLATMNTSFNAV